MRTWKSELYEFEGVWCIVLAFSRRTTVHKFCLNVGFVFVFIKCFIDCHLTVFYCIWRFIIFQLRNVKWLSISIWFAAWKISRPREFTFLPTFFTKHPASTCQWSGRPIASCVQVKKKNYYNVSLSLSEMNLTFQSQNCSVIFSFHGEHYSSNLKSDADLDKQLYGLEGVWCIVLAFSTKTTWVFALVFVFAFVFIKL